MANVDLWTMTNLKPSAELISYYRNAITKFEQDFVDINSQLLKLEQISSHMKCEEEREALLRDLLELRETVSDINVFVHSERQQVYKLTSEKEILEVENALCQRKLEMLLDIIDVSQEELDIYVRNTKGRQVLRNKCRNKMKMVHQKFSGLTKCTSSLEEMALEAKIISLRRQFEESKVSWDKERASLLEDRDICKKEFQNSTSLNESHVRLISSRLNSAQEGLLSSNKKFVRMKRDIQLKEQKWLAERDKFATQCGRIVTDDGNNFEGVDKYLTDLSDIDQICKVQLKREMTSLKKQLKKEEEMSSLYEEKCLKAQQEVCKLKETNASIISSFKSKVKRMGERIELQETQKEKLVKWKSKQHEGFLTDIKLLRQQIKTVIHQMFKLTNFCNKNGIELDSEALDEVKSVASLVRKVHHSILDSRKRLMKVDHLCDIDHI